MKREQLLETWNRIKTKIGKVRTILEPYSKQNTLILQSEEVVKELTQEKGWWEKWFEDESDDFYEDFDSLSVILSPVLKLFGSSNKKTSSSPVSWELATSLKLNEDFSISIAGNEFENKSRIRYSFRAPPHSNKKLLKKGFKKFMIGHYTKN